MSDNEKALDAAVAIIFTIIMVMIVAYTVGN
jgi:hypothetical protein